MAVGGCACVEADQGDGFHYKEGELKGVVSVFGVSQFISGRKCIDRWMDAYSNVKKAKKICP